VQEPGSSEGDQKYLCPSCKKGINSVSKLLGERFGCMWGLKDILIPNSLPCLPALRACGHVHCADCVDTLLRPALKKAETDKLERPTCLECSKSIKSEVKDLIPLNREGTGFASAGGSETHKKGIAFQG
jgi:hypothetical protein